MQKRAGLLFLAKTTGRILLILENSRWTVPTFVQASTLVNDADSILQQYAAGRLIPIELYLSQDRGFEYSTYVCLTDEEFLPTCIDTFAWASLDRLPKHLHFGLNATLGNQIIRTKIDTILEIFTS
jgi:hypothetical protein